MPLTQLWLTSRNQLEDKQIHQIIVFAGNGQLRDGSPTAEEFREFLTHVPITYLARYAEQCLENSFKESGLALQDIVNEIGRRLGFQVTNGRYRGSSRDIGHDGLWLLPQGHSIVVEVKTTDVFRIDLDTIAQYRKDLIEASQVSEAKSSILIIVGRQDTGDMEAQIRGSRHAWDVRLLSLEALTRLMTLKEEVEDQNIIRRMHEILIPREFTRLDAIVDILFSTAEEVKYVEANESQEVEDEYSLEAPSRASFADGCIKQVEHHLKQTLVKRSRVGYSSPDNSLLVVCLVSKIYPRAGHERYWFAFRPTHRDFLMDSPNSYVILGCGSEETVLLIPFSDLQKWLEDMHVTETDGRVYWHIEINASNDKVALHRKRGTKPVDLMEYLLPI